MTDSRTGGRAAGDPHPAEASIMCLHVAPAHPTSHSPIILAADAVIAFDGGICALPPWEPKTIAEHASSL